MAEAEHLPKRHLQIFESLPNVVVFVSSKIQPQKLQGQQLQSVILPSVLLKTIQEVNLMLNDDKTEFLILVTKQQLAKVNIDNIKVGSVDVSPVRVVRNLGSWFDS